MNRRSAVVTLAVALWAVAPLQAQDETIGIAVGSTVKGPIAVQDLDGNAVNLASYLGQKPALVEFWATWCGLCRALMPQFEALSAQQGKDIEILIVAVGVGQSRASVKRHVIDHKMPGRVFWDASGAATRVFEAPSTSYVVSLDRAGTVAYTGLGDKQRIDVAAAKALRK